MAKDREDMIYILLWLYFVCYYDYYLQSKMMYEGEMIQQKHVHYYISINIRTCY